MRRAKFRNVFVVTYGRSGSTLLQGLLNSIPGYLIRGENEGIAIKLAQIRTALISRRIEPDRDLVTHPWYGASFFTPDHVAAALRQLVDTLIFGDLDRKTIRSYGFKEIRYDLANLKGQLDLLRALYPDAAFIFNSRLAEDVVRSEFQKGRSQSTLEQLDRAFADYASAFPDHSLHVRYDDLIGGATSLRNLFGFLAEDYDEERTRAVLCLKHSYHTNYTSHSDFPFFAKLGGRISEVFDVFVLDRLAVESDGARLSGVMIPSAIPSERGERAQPKLSLHSETCVLESAEYGLPSPAYGARLGTHQALKARFKLRLNGAPRAGDRLTVPAADGDITIVQFINDTEVLGKGVPGNGVLGSGLLGSGVAASEARKSRHGEPFRRSFQSAEAPVGKSRQKKRGNQRR